MSTREERIKAEIALLKEKQKQLEGKKREKERKDETRRKILIGSLILEGSKGDLGEAFLKALDKYLKRDYDRALFGLPALPPKMTPPPKMELPDV